MAKVLIVDDDVALADMMCAWLRNARYIVDVIYDGRDAQQLIGMYNYDLMVLDWELPGSDGIEICTAYRAGGGVSPILFLTGRADVKSKIQGLDAGADDYLAKPFEFLELLARVSALLRRKPEVAPSILNVDALSLELESRLLTFEGEKISLTAKEFSLLEFFMKNPGRRFSSREILEAIWPADTKCTEDTVRSSVRHLRKKLARSGKANPIETAGKGYMLSSRSAVEKGK